MKTTPFIWISLTAMLLYTFPAAATEPAGALVETVRQATVRFHNVEEATAAGYANTLNCVSGPQEQTVPQDALRPCQLLPTLLAIQHFEKQSCGEATE